MIRAASSVLACVVVVALAGACAPSPMPAAEVGAALFADARVSTSAFNTASCATCHTVNGRAYDGGPDDAIRPGHDLGGAVWRPAWWNGASSSLLDATNVCLVNYMRAAPWSREEPVGRAIYEFLLRESPTTSQPALTATAIENVVELPRGDPRRGERVWELACASCHGAPHTGAGRVSELVSIVPEDSASFAATIGFSTSLVIVEKVRHGSFFGVGGTMPLYVQERLDDDDLAALITFLVPDGS